MFSAMDADWRAVTERALAKVDEAALALESMAAERDARDRIATIRMFHARDLCAEKDPECSVCSVLDCPMGDPLHYHHDGCPSEEF